VFQQCPAVSQLLTSSCGKLSYTPRPEPFTLWSQKVIAKAGASSSSSSGAAAGLQQDGSSSGASDPWPPWQQEAPWHQEAPGGVNESRGHGIIEASDILKDPLNWLAGDWECSTCGNHNFASRKFCNFWMCKQNFKKGDWLCSACHRHNYHSRARCDCGEWR
jgi:hypothetical protein